MEKKSSKETCTYLFRVEGMTCTSCELIIERSVKKIRGVYTVSIDHATGAGVLTHDSDFPVDTQRLQESLRHHKGYTVYADDDTVPLQRREWKEIIVALLGVALLYPIFKSIGVFSGSSGALSADSFTFGAVFLVGIVASLSSCTALVGSIILSFSANYSAAHPHATGIKKFQPHIFFNIGRLVSYFIFGGLVGVLGSVIAPSPRFTGILTILIALVMILLAIDILKLFRVGRFVPRLPRAWSRKIHSLGDSDNPLIAFVGGALTFFLPCGFTQSMQLYALSTGSFAAGSLVMLVFALGTLPALLAVGAVASFSRGAFARYFLKFSGVLVLFFAVYTLQNGLALTGFSIADFVSRFTTRSSSSAAVLEAAVQGGKQVVSMAVDGLYYKPDNIVVQKGVPVEWRIDGSGATGCTSVIVVPSLGISQVLAPGENVVEFIPQKSGKVAFTCGMGMARGQFTVVDGSGGSPAADNTAPAAGAATPPTAPVCDPTVQNCIR